MEQIKHTKKVKKDGGSMRSDSHWLFGLWSSGLKSFNYWEWEVFAALWIQPHAVSSFSKGPETWAFALVTRPNSQLGMGRPAWCNYRPNLKIQCIVPLTLYPHLGYKPTLRGSASAVCWKVIIKADYTVFLPMWAKKS